MKVVQKDIKFLINSTLKLAFTSFMSVIIQKGFYLGFSMVRLSVHLKMFFEFGFSTVRLSVRLKFSLV